VASCSPALTVSVLVPTLQEERTIAATLDHLAALPGTWEVVVADGGSRDATVALARAHPSVPRVLVQAGGRAAQCNAAAAAATGQALYMVGVPPRWRTAAVRRGALRAVGRSLS
jgi:glycosyltransferase involved in cell wall biosynthesis